MNEQPPAGPAPLAIRPAGPFDLVASALAVHHLDGPGKAELFRRLAGVLAGALLALAAAAPAALAVNRPLPDGRPAFVPTYPAASPASTAVAGGGMPGWQITLIAVAAALVTAIAAVFLDRMLAARRSASSTTA